MAVTLEEGSFDDWFVLMDGHRYVSDACVEGNAEEWRAILAALEAGEACSFRRCAMHFIEQGVEFWSPRNSAGRPWVCTKAELPALIANIRSVIATEPTEEPFDLAAFYDEKSRWSIQTFGPGDRYEGVIKHIRKELCEIELEPSDVEEWVDVALLAMDGAFRSAKARGYDFVMVLRDKQRRNTERQWPDWRILKPGEVSEHVRAPILPERIEDVTREHVVRAAYEAPDPRVAAAVLDTTAAVEAITEQRVAEEIAEWLGTERDRAHQGDQPLREFTVDALAEQIRAGAWKAGR